jgi:hypothetical protein
LLLAVSRNEKINLVLSDKGKYITMFQHNESVMVRIPRANNKQQLPCTNCGQQFANKSRLERHRYFCNPATQLADYGSSQQKQSAEEDVLGTSPLSPPPGLDREIAEHQDGILLGVFKTGLWIRIRIGCGFKDFVDPDPYWESGSRGKKTKKFQWEKCTF